MPKKRKAVTISTRQAVWEKTGGRCHICGRVLVFDAIRGQIGRWNVDHIVSMACGGRDSVKNYLPICNVCNRLKWHFKGRKMRKLLQFGVITLSQSKNKTSLGKAIDAIYQKRIVSNEDRRNGKVSKWYYR